MKIIADLLRLITRPVLATVFTVFFITLTFAQDEKIGKVQQGLVGGKEVDEKVQEEYGLLKFEIGAGACTASLLRNGWAISAAHCADLTDASRNTMRDPSRPGQNVLRPLQDLSITAAWGGGQTKRVTRVETFWPYDIALIQLDSPILVHGKATGYVREVFFDQFPYFGTPVNVTIKVFGAGINQFAFGEGDSAMPSNSDGKFRAGTSRVSREDPNGTLYWYPADGNNMIAGGDSGGPSFATVGTNQTTVLVGVHALTLPDYVPGKPQTGWRWVKATPWAADAPIKTVWPQIANIMGPLPKPDTPSEAFTGRHKAVFEDTGFSGLIGVGKVEDNILYGVRNDGDLIWHRHFIDFRSGTPRHSFAPTKRVGNGWKGGFTTAFPAGQQTIYTIADNGDLRWHWHIGAFDGSYRWGSPSNVVGIGWSGFREIIPMDDGVIYTIMQDGILRWHRNPNYAKGGGSVNTWAQSKDVGWGWGGAKTYFSGGKGVIYVVNQDGKLMWYRHKEYLNPPAIPASNASNAERLAWERSWDGPREVGSGWGGFVKLFSPGEGHIYGVLPNGDVMYYRHLGWMMGKFMWNESVKGKIASGWDGYAFAFARVITSERPTDQPK